MNLGGGGGGGRRLWRTLWSSTSAEVVTRWILSDSERTGPRCTRLLSGLEKGPNTQGPNTKISFPKSLKSSGNMSWFKMGKLPANAGRSLPTRMVRIAQVWIVKVQERALNSASVWVCLQIEPPKGCDPEQVAEPTKLGTITGHRTRPLEKWDLQRGGYHPAATVCMLAKGVASSR